MGPRALVTLVSKLGEDAVESLTYPAASLERDDTCLLCIVCKSILAVPGHPRARHEAAQALIDFHNEPELGDGHGRYLRCLAVYGAAAFALAEKFAAQGGSHSFLRAREAVTSS